MIKKLYLKHKELINYIIFGVATTAVNFAVFWLMEMLLPQSEITYLFSNAIAWFVSVVFAYVTNKLFVFSSKSWKMGVVIKESAEFFGARIFSFALEEAGLWFFVELLSFSEIALTVIGFEITGELISKLILAVVVVVLNYFFSKFIIFKNKKENTQDQRS